MQIFSNLNNCHDYQNKVPAFKANNTSYGTQNQPDKDTFSARFKKEIKDNGLIFFVLSMIGGLATLFDIAHVPKK